MFLREKKFSFEIRFVNLGPCRSPRYDACSEGFPIGSGPRTVARCGRRSQLLRLPYPGSNLSTPPLSDQIPSRTTRSLRRAHRRCNGDGCRSAFRLESRAPPLRVDVETREDRARPVGVARLARIMHALCALLPRLVRRRCLRIVFHVLECLGRGIGRRIQVRQTRGPHAAWQRAKLCFSDAGATEKLEKATAWRCSFFDHLPTPPRRMKCGYRAQWYARSARVAPVSGFGRVLHSAV